MAVGTRDVDVNARSIRRNAGKADSVRFPRTRYQGSKRKLAPIILNELRHVEFISVLDAFGGSGAIAYELKRAGKQVTYNDILSFNHQIGLALIENDSLRLDDDEIASIGLRQTGVAYDDFIERTFEGIYFTAEENRWLDVAVQNVRRMMCKYKRSIAWFALFQSALAKRPYNLFHRKNLYMRMADVKRGFGNKASWDRSFDAHFKVFAADADRAVFDSGQSCRATCRDALEIEPIYDLVYIDTPYINHAGVGVDYRDFYHFLEGMVCYDAWPSLIDRKSRHRRLIRRDDPWSNPSAILDMYRTLFDRFRNSVLVVSYRSDGVPTIDELHGLLRVLKSHVRICERVQYQYALSKNRRSNEVLLLAYG